MFNICWLVRVSLFICFQEVEVKMIEGQELMTFDKQMRLGSKEHQSSAAMKENGVKGKWEYRALGKNDKPCRYFTQYSLECKSKEDS